MENLFSFFKVILILGVLFIGVVLLAVIWQYVLIGMFIIFIIMVIVQKIKS